MLSGRELQYEVTAVLQTYSRAAHYVETIVEKVKTWWKIKKLIWGCKAVCVNIFLLTAEKSQMNFFFVHHQQPRVSAVLKGSISELSVCTVYTLNANKSIEKWQYVPLFTRLIEKDYSCFWRSENCIVLDFLVGSIYTLRKYQDWLDAAEQITITSQSRTPSRTDSILVHLA